MKKILLTAAIFAPALFFSCQGGSEETTQEQEVQSEQHDSMQNSVLEEADRMLREGNFDTTISPADSAGTVK